MITAKEAKELSDKKFSVIEEKAMAWAESELSFLEEHILDAIENGLYSTSYFWGNSILTDAGITNEAAKKAMLKTLHNLGYTVTASPETDRLRIYVRWEWAEWDI